MSFLASVGTIIADAIVDKIAEKLEAIITKAMNRNAVYEAIDKETDATLKQIADAKTPEERWAYVHKLQEQKAKLKAGASFTPFN